MACPYVGLPDDARTRFAFATPAHRCYARRRAALISLSHQGSYCLSTDFPKCERFPAEAPVGAMVSSTQEVAGREARVAIGVVLLLALLAAIVLVVALVGLGGVGAA